LKVVVHSYFDMFTYKAMDGVAFVLSYAVLLTIFSTFDLGKAHGKTAKNNRDRFNRSSSLNISSRSRRFASHPLA